VPRLFEQKITVTYKGKSLAVLFYGNRRNFFEEPARRKAQEAIDALGTNAFPFLLSNLQQRPGNGALYFKFYRAMPKWLQAKLRYPISGDDIKFITFDQA
jgi:hypothetical protein